MIGAVIAAFLGPNVLGLLAVVFARFLERFWTWSPSTRLEVLLLIFLAVFVPAIVVYSFLTRRRGDTAVPRDRPAVPEGRSRFLPPLEIVLLQIGNATFLAFAIMLAVMVLGSLSLGLRAVATYRPLAAHDFSVSLSVAAAVMLLSLRPTVLRSLSWRRLSAVWMKWPGLAGIAVAGFLAVGAGWNLGFLEIDWSGGQLRATTFFTLYAASVSCLLVADLLVRACRPRRLDPDALLPLAWLLPAVGLVWLVSVLIYALYLNGVLLTLRGHLAGL